MRSPTLLGQLLRDQVLIAVLSAILLVLGGMGASAILLRKHQDSTLRSLGKSMCHAIAEEREEHRATYAEAAGEALHETDMSDTVIQVEGPGRTLIASSGALPGWSPTQAQGLKGGDCFTERGRGEGFWQGKRACAQACDAQHRIVVAASNIHGDRDVREALKVLCVSFLVLLGGGSLVGRRLIRRRLEPLQRLAEAASHLRVGTATALEVGAEASELARLETSLDRLLRKLHEALLREKRFTQEASHELRTSLTVLRARVEGLSRRGASPDELHAELGALVAQIDSLDRLVGALLLLARSEEDAGLPGHPVNLCDLAREAAQSRQNADGPDSPAPQVIAPDEILVAGSEELLGRALDNLVENARKFAGAGAHIRIMVDRDDARARVVVEDDGPGIPAASRPHVFERFYRDATRRGAIPGTGLGLAVVRSIVIRHRGEVSTGESRELGGEAVRFSLPLLEAGTARASAPRPA